MDTFQITHIFYEAYYLKWGTELQQRKKNQAISHGEDSLSIAVFLYDACYIMSLLACAYTSKSLNLLSNQFFTYICTIDYCEKAPAYF